MSLASERKIVTILFADLVGSTALAASLDPERFRDVIAAFHGMVTDELAALRGRAENYFGDAVLGVFGVPLAHDDDAVRAIRAGLAIVAHADRLGRELGLPGRIHVRVGINTGPVAVGTSEDRNLVLGAEVNLAARLQQAAEHDEVLVGGTTRLLAADAVVFGPERLISAKGFEGDVRAWPVDKLEARSSRRSIPLVNRRRELALLTDTFERVVETSRAHLVTLLGEPGIGKSRVVEEFLAQLPEDATVLTGQSSPFEEEGSLGSIGQMIRRELGEDAYGGPEDVRRGLDAVVRRWVPEDGAAETAARLGLALGLEETEEENRYREAEVRHGLLTLLSGLTAAGPVVLVFEDLHEANPALLDLLEELVKDTRKLPVMVVCVARWEFLEGRPGWAGGIPDAVTLWVEPLTLAHATQLALEAGDFDHEEQAERIAVHAGGNPFFIVETTGMLMHEERELPPRTAGPVTRLLPASVQAVIAERLDHLSPAAKELARRASVFPRGAFDLAELAMIADPRPDLLEELENEEFLHQDEERPSQWRFRSDVLRDVAYEGLAKRERQRLHLRVANRLSEAETADRYPRSIAFHLEQAARAALDLNPKDRHLAERAVEALTHAGDLARRRIESRAAVELYERALAMCGPESGWGEREALLLSLMGEARYWLGEFEAGESTLERALEVGRESVRVRAHASRYLADITLTIRGEPDRAQELFAEALEAARELGEPDVLARTLLMAAWAPYWRNDLDLAREMFEEALTIARGDGSPDPWAEGRALVGLASVTSPVGDEEDALALGLEALEVGREAGQPFTAAVARETVSGSLRRMLRLDEAREHSDAAIRTFRELGARWELASAFGDRGTIHRLRGDLLAAEEDLRESFRLCRELDERALVTWTASELARLLVVRGDLAGARQVLDDPAARLSAAEPGSAAAFLFAEATLALAEGELEVALDKALAGVLADRDQEGEGLPNPVAARVWWVGSLFGEQAAGGAETLARARERLEQAHWRQALHEPEVALPVAETPARGRWARAPHTHAEARSRISAPAPRMVAEGEVVGQAGLTGICRSPPDPVGIGASPWPTHDVIPSPAACSRSCSPSRWGRSCCPAARRPRPASRT
jgi:class 3 adenylate cyclase/tetratricopeptide (TPR) repeat protein